jgi:large subunit ribosomal protein L9
MAIEVLLMSDVKNLGAEGETVTVADGYARNYLLPKNLAAPVTEATRRRLAKQQLQRADKVEAQLDAARAMATRLAGVSCTIPARAASDEQLYGSVTATEITNSLANQGIEVDRSDVLLKAPIKELGIFGVPIRLHPEVEATLKVWVVEE